MPVYEDACASATQAASAPVDAEGYFRIENLTPGTCCVAGIRTVTLGVGQELEVSFSTAP